MTADAVSSTASSGLTVAQLLEPEFLHPLRRLAVEARRALAGTIKGEKRSVKRGTSVEFADFRDYAAGDDLRYVDWNAYGRLERLFIKLFMEEEDLQIQLLVDASASMQFGEPTKAEAAQRIAAALGYIGLTGLDRVGAMAFADDARAEFRAVRGRGFVVRLFEFLTSIEFGGVTNLTRSLRTAAHRIRGAGLVIVLSDFFAESGYESALKSLLARGFQVAVIQVLDDTELVPNLAGDLRLVDCETGQVREVTIGASLRQLYIDHAEAYCAGLRDFCRRHDIVYVRALTSIPAQQWVARYLRDAGLVR